jgi:MFS family permease
LKNHSLFATLKNLTGNPRGCVYPEPLWGIPFNLYAPYVSIYMVALGLTDKEIGLIVSISGGFQVLLALLSGVVTDKLGRRLTTLLFDIVAWTIPSIISAVAQNFWYFLAAGIINSVWRITLNSWSCLLVEDAEESQLVDIYTWIYIANQIVGFVAPLAGILIGIFSLVPTVRGLYIFAAIMFTVKAVVTYQMTQETRQGMIRLHETRHQGIFSLLGGYGDVLQGLIRSPQTLYTAGIMLVVSISAMINGSFWGIIVTEKLHIPAQHLAIFPFVKTAIMFAFFFMVNPLLNKLHFKLPMTIGFLGFIISQILLISAPDKSYSILLISVFLEACSFAAVNPLVDRMIVQTIEPKERARIQSILYVGIILLTSPFGWIAGSLSTINKDLPFVINIILFTAGAVLAYLTGKASQEKLRIESASVL